eukprot:4686117-Prymnesium_polylepis.1
MNLRGASAEAIICQEFLPSPRVAISQRRALSKARDTHTLKELRPEANCATSSRRVNDAVPTGTVCSRVQRVASWYSR